MIKKILDLTLKTILGFITFLTFFTIITSIICLIMFLLKITIMGNIFLGFMMLVLLLAVPCALYDLGNSTIKDIKRYLKRKGY